MSSSYDASHDSSNPSFVDYPLDLGFEDSFSSSSDTIWGFVESSKSEDSQRVDGPAALPLSPPASPPLAALERRANLSTPSNVVFVSSDDEVPTPTLVISISVGLGAFREDWGFFTARNS
ncbi:hypothetical protein ACFE04_019515 [Oxalis oulophora]